MTTHCDVINALFLNFTIFINLQKGSKQCSVWRGIREARKLGILCPYSGGQKYSEFSFSLLGQARLLAFPPWNVTQGLSSLPIPGGDEILCPKSLCMPPPQLLGIEVGGLGARRPKPKMISSRGSRKGLRAECYGTEMLRTYFTFEPSAREVNWEAEQMPVWEFVSANGSSIEWSGDKERSGRNLDREREKRKYDVS